ncbi:hypothetical protein BGY98DRAFT_935430 [Russula aff. rugulosa BPL654]|nr:hypothetical protein BGY98DRAFT_935430 [Russula aff. rugulosa BPL654]
MDADQSIQKRKKSDSRHGYNASGSIIWGDWSDPGSGPENERIAGPRIDKTNKDNWPRIGFQLKTLREAFWASRLEVSRTRSISLPGLLGFSSPLRLRHQVRRLIGEHDLFIVSPFFTGDPYVAVLCFSVKPYIHPLWHWQAGRPVWNVFHRLTSKPYEPHIAVPPAAFYRTERTA